MKHADEYVRVLLAWAESVRYCGRCHVRLARYRVVRRDGRRMVRYRCHACAATVERIVASALGRSRRARAS